MQVTKRCQSDRGYGPYEGPNNGYSLLYPPEVDTTSKALKDTGPSNVSDVNLETRSWPRSIKARFDLRYSTRSWAFGLYTGLYASITVLLSNIALMMIGLVSHGGVVDAVGTIAQGEAHRIARISTAYHVLINVMSTVLLTSSNYAMQTLCAPTRDDINDAHAKGHWLEIGIMSIHNLRHVKRRRMILWVLLAFSSAPLHFL
jgi:hypothetical protein